MAFGRKKNEGKKKMENKPSLLHTLPQLIALTPEEFGRKYCAITMICSQKKPEGNDVHILHLSKLAGN